MPESREITIPSTPSGRQQAEEEALSLAEKLGFSEEARFSIKLAMEEAIVNAIKHGNQLDESKHDYVVCRGSSKRLWAQIRDEGPGFQPTDVPDCTAEANLDRPCGRGIMLMRNFMSSVQYNDSGNCVEMEKILDDCY